MLHKIKGYMWYVINIDTLEIIWPKGKTLKPYKYPKCNSLRVSLYKNGKPTYVNIKDIIDKIGVWNDDWSELIAFFKERGKSIRKDALQKKFEKFYIDEAFEEWIVIKEENSASWIYYILNPNKIC